MNAYFMQYIIVITNYRYVMDSAKVFWSGRSQAVRMPKSFRFDTDEKRIRRHWDTVVLESIARDWTWLDSAVVSLDADFAEAALEEPLEQERAALGNFE